MITRNRWTFGLAVAGLAGLVLSALDPLEGAIVSVISAIVLAVSAHMAHGRLRSPLLWAAAMIAAGFAVMVGFSQLGGIGGNSGRSIWLALFILPYPVGWLMGVVLGVRLVKTARAAH